MARAAFLQAVGGGILMIEGLSDEDVAGMAFEQRDAKTLSNCLLKQNPAPSVLDNILGGLVASIAKYYPAAARPDPAAPVSFDLAAEIIKLSTIDQLDIILRLSPRGSGRLRKDAPSLQSETIDLVMRLRAPNRGDDNGLIQELAVMLKPGGRSDLQLKFGRRQRGFPQCQVGIVLSQEIQVDLGRRAKELKDAGVPMTRSPKKSERKTVPELLGESLSQVEKALKAYKRRQQQK
jgi:hypothetical protein